MFCPAPCGLLGSLGNYNRHLAVKRPLPPKPERPTKVRCHQSRL
jgi:hypothetical protein